jgi:hypothetical protein
MTTKALSSPAADRRLLGFIGVSLGIHLVVLVATSLPFIMRGFRPAPAPVAEAAQPAAAAPTAPAPATAPGTAAAPSSTAPAAGAPAAAKPAKPTAKPGARRVDLDAEYSKDDKLTPDELRKGPSLDTGLDEKK